MDTEPHAECSSSWSNPIGRRQALINPRHHSHPIATASLGCGKKKSPTYYKSRVLWVPWQGPLWHQPISHHSVSLICQATQRGYILLIPIPCVRVWLDKINPSANPVHGNQTEGFGHVCHLSMSRLSFRCGHDGKRIEASAITYCSLILCPSVQIHFTLEFSNRKKRTFFSPGRYKKQQIYCKLRF